MRPTLITNYLCYRHYSSRRRRWWVYRCRRRRGCGRRQHCVAAKMRSAADQPMSAASAPREHLGGNGGVHHHRGLAVKMVQASLLLSTGILALGSGMARHYYDIQNYRISKKCHFWAPRGGGQGSQFSSYPPSHRRKLSASVPSVCNALSVAGITSLSF